MIGFPVVKNIFSVVDKLEIEEDIGCDDIEDEDYENEEKEN